MTHKTITCTICNNTFVWTKGEQNFYRSKGLNQPKTCPTCRKKKNSSSPNPHGEIIGTFLWSRFLMVGLPVIVILALGWWFSGDITFWGLIFGWLLVINGVTYSIFKYDKTLSQQKGNSSRVPETVLLGLCALGGSPLGYVAMETFRHKTVKQTFRIPYWVIVSLQLLLLSGMLYLFGTGVVKNGAELLDWFTIQFG